MRSKVLLLVAMVFASVTLFAQPGGGQGGPGGQRQMPEPKEMATKSVETLTKELKLDKKQEKAIYDIEFAKFTSMSEMMKKQDMSREKMQAIEKKSDTAIEKVLKDDQNKKYAAYKKKQEEERAKRQQSGGGKQRQNN